MMEIEESGAEDEKTQLYVSIPTLHLPLRTLIRM